MRLVLASNNAAKLVELQALFAALPLSIVTQGSLGVPEAEEPHQTFVENALAKARHAARHVAGAAISDDSGLCVDALGGAPGVHSARYATLTLPDADRETQRRAQDAANNEWLLARMLGVADRRARFVCTLVAVRSADDPEPLVAVGRWHGEILTAPRGHAGFGYNPVVGIPALGCSVAELGSDLKNALSHRALAAQQMLALMRETWHLG